MRKPFWLSLILLAACGAACKPPTPPHPAPPPAPAPPAPPPPAALKSPSLSTREVVEYLASDELAGRQMGSEGERKAAQYVVDRLRRMGLEADVQPFSKGVNAVGVRPGRVEEAVVIGAHLDHLGKKGNDIYRGADDNASGVAALLALAERFAARPARRTIVFCAFGGEEVGILGSRHYVKHPARPAVAMLNMDMVGRLSDGKLICFGVNTSDVWEKALAESNAGALKLAPGKGGVGPSDHTAFYEAGIPVLHFFTGPHADYHKPTDTADKLNYDGLARIVDFIEAVARRVADMDGKPSYVRVKERLEAEGEPPKDALPYLGAMPNYEDMDRMIVHEVVEGSPASKSGLKSGDEILALDGVDVEDLQHYSRTLRSFKPGQEITLTIKRGEQTLELKVVLGARERKE